MNILKLHPIVVNWFIAEVLSHRNQDFEKEFNLPPSGNRKDYIKKIIQMYIPDSTVHVLKKEKPFDYYIMVVTPNKVFHAFAGTHTSLKDLSDWKCNADMEPDENGMHPGWRDAVKRFYSYVDNRSKLFKDKINSFSGHSQGGPLSVYLMYHLIKKYNANIDTYWDGWTYESPVIGTEYFCNELAGAGVKVNRIWCHGDPVVKYFKNIGKHYGNSIKLPIVNWLIQTIPFLRTYAHSYSLNTAALIKWCRKRKLKNEVKFLKKILERTII